MKPFIRLLKQEERDAGSKSIAIVVLQLDFVDTALGDWKVCDLREEGGIFCLLWKELLD